MEEVGVGTTQREHYNLAFLSLEIRTGQGREGETIIVGMIIGGLKRQTILGGHIPSLILREPPKTDPVKTGIWSSGSHSHCSE